MPTFETTSQRADCLSLTTALADAYKRSAWNEVRALFHEEALLCTMAANQEVLGPDALIRVYKRLASDITYQVDQVSMSAIDDDACIVTGQIRYPLADGGFAEGRRAWILTCKEGLLFRSYAYTSAAKARAAYASHGLSLGIEDTHLL